MKRATTVGSSPVSASSGSRIVGTPSCRDSSHRPSAMSMVTHAPSVMKYLTFAPNLAPVRTTTLAGLSATTSPTLSK